MYVHLAGRGVVLCRIKLCLGIVQWTIRLCFCESRALHTQSPSDTLSSSASGLDAVPSFPSSSGSPCGRR